MGPCQLVGPLARAKTNALWPGQKKWRRHNPVTLLAQPSNPGAIFLPRPKGIFFARTKGPMGPGPGPMASCSVLLYYYAVILYYYIILYIILYIF